MLYKRLLFASINLKTTTIKLNIRIKCKILQFVNVYKYYKVFNLYVHRSVLYKNILNALLIWVS